ncbi:MAG: hypothetical protein IK099_08435 [Clostridia bacterium]|nr:hypothetical protein [Clostridia bacterium]
MISTSLLNRQQDAYSPLVAQAQSYLYSSMQGNKPQAYRSRYEEQIAGLYDQIMNRPAFSYNAEKDPLYRQYRDQYIREGQRAMLDTVGASAALTGGYGNSWANTAGYQAYGRYLQALNDQLPQLEKLARENYEAEGNQLKDRADLALSLDNREYGWYRDAVNDWQYDAKLAMEQQKFDVEVQKYRDQMLASMSAQPVYPNGVQAEAAEKKEEEIRKEEEEKPRYTWNQLTANRDNQAAFLKYAQAKNRKRR